MDLERHFKFAFVCFCYFGSSTANFSFGERKNDNNSVLSDIHLR